MPRIVVSPERDRVTTVELRNESITDQTVTFDSAGVSNQDLDDDVAEQFAEQYDDVEIEDDVEGELDEVAQLLSGTVDEISDEIEAGAYDDRLDEIEERERTGDGRTTVVGAVEKRREELADDEEAA